MHHGSPIEVFPSGEEDGWERQRRLGMADRTQLQQLLGEWRNDIVRELLEVSR